MNLRKEGFGPVMDSQEIMTIEKIKRHTLRNRIMKGYYDGVEWFERTQRGRLRCTRESFQNWLDRQKTWIS